MNNILIDHLLTNGYNKQIFNEKNINISSDIEFSIYLAARFQSESKSIVVVKRNAYQAKNLYDTLVSIIDESHCLLYTSEESIRLETIAASPENNEKRLEVLVSLIEESPKVLIINSASLIKRILPKREFIKDIIDISVGDTIEREELILNLIKTGYIKDYRVELPLTFTFRGGVIDIFSINYQYPIRIEFFDNEVESIRFFDVESQRTVSETDAITIIPASTNYIYKQLKENCKPTKYLNIEDDQENLDKDLPFERSLFYYNYSKEDINILDYIDDYVFIYHDYQKIKNSITEMYTDTTEYLEELYKDNYIFNCNNLLIDINKINQ